MHAAIRDTDEACREIASAALAAIPLSAASLATLLKHPDVELPSTVLASATSSRKRNRKSAAVAQPITTIQAAVGTKDHLTAVLEMLQWKQNIKDELALVGPLCSIVHACLSRAKIPRTRPTTGDEDEEESDALTMCAQD